MALAGVDDIQDRQREVLAGQLRLAVLGEQCDFAAEAVLAGLLPGA
ncbi:hypothetical protein [Microlunatus endophyticus]